MTDDPDIPEFLREIYDTSPDTAEPSPALRARTVAELRRRKLIESPGARRHGAWLAAALVLLAFTGGYALGSRGDVSSTSTIDRIPAGDLAAATELVQGVGTSYAFSLDALVQDLGTGSAADINTARDVVRALTAAQTEALDRLLGPVGAEGPVHAADPSGMDRPPVVWF